ncbi:uncharacterized protein KNAG_0K01230 [Huiozyma naganishii CBS 8797]|uniref:PH domain-containing protein n=1 Tax=Huiozyma naganishii (strain ATCC MYA-139 / BCRC 22969 / CBS 8797 / KCTC 17520 / NBRC 10181 / NCYC 3082 / Yp74L-3) TaxID=1071383 RepID=J7RRM4_HUIN7|nr:hypothetical protein KNAG_0K01230 [Kazachstania naganishii CBS 8797]CCK72488.1 hypothetical protein KNAG_0K01230 [Kazachstania naganishii CBS 8797]
MEVPILPINTALDMANTTGVRQPDDGLVSPSESMTSKPLLKLKLLNVLRKGSLDDLQILLRDQFVPKHDPNVIEVANSVLQYAVQVAPLQLIKSIVSNKDMFNQLGFDVPLININEKDNLGNTPLHMAAFQSRADVVSYLMDLPGINDTVTNDMNLQPFEICKDLNIAQLMQFKRSSYIAEIATEFRTAFNNRDFQHLESILSNPRNFNLLDINGMDPKTGDTVLHEFVKKRDVIMCRWLLEHGADPFKRDAKGKLPLDLLKKVSTTEEVLSGSASTTTATTKQAIDMELKKMLEKSAMEQSVIDITGVNTSAPVVSSANNTKIMTPPTFKGYLKKWTNFAQGYKLRYFILSDDGKLSYYIDQSDTQNACRGSLNVSNCYLHLDSSEKLKFEIISGSNRNNSSEELRWHLKGNHPIETNRWVWAIQGAIRYAKDKNKGLVPTMITNKPLNNRPNAITARDVLSLQDKTETANSDDMLSLNSTHQLLGEQSPPPSLPQPPLPPSEPCVSSPDLAKASQLVPPTFPPLTFNPTLEDKDMADIESSSGDDDDYDDDGDMFDIINGTDGDDVKISYGPFSHKVHMIKRSITIDFTELIELLSDESLAKQNLSSNRDIWNTVGKTLTDMNTNFMKLNELTQQRDRKFISMLSKQRDLNNVWMKSMKELELELIEKDTKLMSLDKERKQLKKMLASAAVTAASNQGSDTNKAVGDSSTDNNMEGNGATLEEIAAAINVSDSEESQGDEFFDAEELSDEEYGNPDQKNDNDGAGTNEKVDDEENPFEATAASENSAALIEEISSDSFVTTAQLEKFGALEKEGTFLGYEKEHRSKLDLTSDDRPKISLWGVLKSMVGQDLTKMTLPVSFNEPTSMLQRVTEDIEYSNLLSKASTFPDSTLRLMYVAAFTVSPFASTINRVAKPFNPLLGETYEYVNSKEQYRFFTEQVSHHPPISATWTESPKWDYYGETNVYSKFTGRSFVIKHLGRWFVTMRPDADSNGATEEVYTYKKPQNTVIGILVGKPEVDNSGEVRIDNRTTGDYCIMNYKARGWTSVGAYEVRGEVFNKDGKKCWIFGGHWDDALYGKKVLNGNDSALQLDSHVGTDDPKYDGTKFCIWKIHKRLTGVPFNLTPFAITLNDPNPKLVQWVAPTDSRLRPDQRAMEDGRYDEAAVEKNRLEEKQRAVRKEREAQKVKYQPKYFTLERDPDSGDKIWKFTGEYWNLRKKHDWSKSNDIF